jgi:ABC-type nitrate/sulfonate/bicarbonate transport system permease component
MIVSARLHWLQMMAGIIILCCVLEGVGLTHAFGPLWPVPTEIALQFFGSQTRTALLGSARISAVEMLEGLVAGLVAGILLALMARFLPALSQGFGNFAVVVQAIPIIAVAPILLTAIPRSLIPATLASIGVFFVGFMSFSAGLRAVEQNYRDFFRVLGASKIRYFWHLGLPMAIPLLVNGISYAIPGAIVGAVIGEWFGVGQGLGVVLLQTMRSGETQTLMAASTLILAMALAGYGVTFAVGRWTYGRLR